MWSSVGVVLVSSVVVLACSDVRSGAGFPFFLFLFSNYNLLVYWKADVDICDDVCVDCVKKTCLCVRYGVCPLG